MRGQPLSASQPNQFWRLVLAMCPFQQISELFQRTGGQIGLRIGAECSVERGLTGEDQYAECAGILCGCHIRIDTIPDHGDFVGFQTIS